jgi:hypothetical protein
VKWALFPIALPSGAALQCDVDPAGHLRGVVEVHRDAVTLTLLADALRAAVVDVDAQRAILAVEARP